MINAHDLDPEDPITHAVTLAQRLIRISLHEKKHCLPQEEPWNSLSVAGML